MDPKRWERVKELYLAAAALGLDEKSAFLDKACGGDHALKEEVETLIAFEAEGDRLFASTAGNGIPGQEDTAGSSRRAGDAGGRQWPELQESLEGFVAKHPELDAELRKLIETSRTLGDFKIIRPIGRGAMGTVFEAHQLSLNRRVALKVLSSHLSYSQDSVLKFRREAEAGGRQHHPGIVAVYAVGEAGGVHFIAQELVEGGETLADRLEKIRAGGVQPPGYFRAAAKFTARIADALQHAHEQGVIHRDVKPSNILLTREGHPKVSDFGLAKVDDALALSRTGDFAGTPYYMSPEQALNWKGKIDKRTDVYSLGVTLYEMLTLQHPFEGETTQEVIKRIVFAEPLEPHKVNPRVARELSVVCLKAMDKDAHRRYKSMADFADDLRRFAAGDVVLAQPAGLATKIVKRVKRRPAASAAVALGAAALLLAVVVLPWIILKMERDKLFAVEAERAETEREAKKARAINQFLNDMLSSVDPYLLARDAQGLNDYREPRDVKVIDVLDSASERIEKELASQPLVKASIQRTIGDVYFRLGDFKKAEAQIVGAVGTFREMLGEEHPDTLAAERVRACVLSDTGRHGDAESLLRSVLEAEIRVLGEDHPETCLAMNNLANIQLRLGRYRDAEALSRRVIEIASRPGANLLLTWASAMSGVGEALVYQGRYEEAEECYKAALEKRALELGEESLTAVFYRVDEARRLSREGHPEKAEALYRECLESVRRLFGDKHPYTLRIQSNLAGSVANLERFEEAEKLFLDTLAARQGVQGPVDHLTVFTQRELARLYYRQDRFDDAEPLLRESLDAQIRALGAEHPDALDSEHLLASVCAQRGLFREAREHFTHVLDAQRRTLGADSPDTLATEYDFAWMLNQQRSWKEARAPLQDAIIRMRKKLGDEHRTTLRSLGLLGIILYQLGQYAEAEAACREAYNGMVRSVEVFGPDHPDTLSAEFNFAAALLGQSQFTEAEPLCRDTADRLRRTRGEQDGKTLNAAFNVAFCLYQQGRYGEAEAEFRGIVDCCDANPGSNKGARVSAGEGLGLSLMKQGDAAGALSAFERAAALVEQHPDETKAAASELYLSFGEFLLAQKQYEEAQKHLLAAYELKIEQDAAAGVLRSLIKLYEAWGKPEEAARYRALAAPRR